MEPSLLGHLYPKIDTSICIDCGLCIKGCPSLHVIEGNTPVKAYAAWSKEEEDYKSSTSGGVASVLSKYILSNGGVVYGCSVLPGIRIEHIRIDDINKLHRLKGSKYVQSSIINVLPQIKKDVANGKKVLFIGTGCQTMAIKRMWSKQPENLYLVDLICHGTPSVEVLRKCIQKSIPINKIHSIKFRTLEGYQLLFTSLNNDILYKSKSLWENRYEDLYLNCFIDGFLSRESCFHCPYAKPQRYTDITIGDFWGLGKEIPCNIPEHKYGISVILPSTEKGMVLTDAINENLNIYERPISEAIKGNAQLMAPSAMNWRIRLFRKVVPIAGVRVAYNTLVADKILKYKLRRILKR